MAAIEVTDLTKVYRSHVRKEGAANAFLALFKRDFRDFVAVDSVSFSIPSGQLVGMLGANGAGKTTTLKMLSGLLHPSSGSATVAGHVPWERSREFRRAFSIVMGQRNQLWWDLPAADSFLLNQKIYGIPEQDYRKRLGELAEKLDVADKLHIQVRRLSLGERMKCELIGALLHNPKILFLDEPTIGLDVVAQHSLREFIGEFNQRGDTTIILTSHYMDDIRALCKRVIIMDEGKILFDGGLDGLVEEFSAHKIVSVVFNQAIPSQSDLLAYGTAESREGDKVSLRVPRLDAPRAAAALLNTFDIADLTIEEVPIEQIIRTIFAKNRTSNESR